MLSGHIPATSKEQTPVNRFGEDPFHRRDAGVFSDRP